MKSPNAHSEWAPGGEATTGRTVAIAEVGAMGAEPGLPSSPEQRLAECMRMGTLNLSALPPLALYVHLPWCLRKCPYCDFNSHEPRGGVELPQAQYIQALLADLDAALPFIWGRRVHSVFFGGGTPSLFAPERLGELIGAIRSRLPLLPGCEITLEANPGTFESERFAAFAQAGVTRLSVGVQSFDDARLQAIGRVHDSAQARAAVEEAARCFRTFNIDLMYALPGQTVADFSRDLEQALAYQPPHVSIYHLTLEPNTYFAKHPPTLPDEDTAFDMLDLLGERMPAAGLQRYEVSAFARQGHACTHNLNYWQFGDYLGIGAGAHSKLSFPHRVVREVRLRDPQRYMTAALQGQALSRHEAVGRADLAFEFMLNALRLRGGFELALFQERTGLPLSAIEPALGAAVGKGWLLQEGAWVKPTALGFDFLSDLQALFLPD
jgi:putative oxygen-independent coproporphyrinogen III oxidase